ncbi:GIY-YIG nuclease family protein [Streptomyces sp. NPDC051362]|uniref:GIY-YIG nuclease family protein n=1 Tax=Streptomyces sp. NPDC051362 TaxID=3365651 RepID=UPI0037876C27
MVDIHTARTALYRLYDEDGVLLYVGITNMPNVRFASHSMKSWWKRVARKDIAWFDNRQKAEQAETKAIHEERPVFNVAKSPWRSVTAAAELGDLPAGLDDFDYRLVEAARVRHEAKRELLEADAELREAVVEGRAADKGPSHMAKLTGFTREWVAKIAPAAKS